MRVPEWIALVYFGYVAVTALVRASGARRVRGVIAAAGVIAVIVSLAAEDTQPFQLVRDWAPGVYAVLGYWLPGTLAGPPRRSFERKLEAIDAPLLPAIDTFAGRAPRVLLEYLELSYLCCYPLVPGAFAWLALHGRVGAADHYWTAVLLALYPCYGLVPWLPTRPPRAIEPSLAIARRRVFVRELNLRVLRDASIQLNTFPSGHAAGAFAAAAVVVTMMPVAGAVLFVLAISIATASVVGRYHYATDAWAGAGVGAAAYACAAWLANGGAWTSV